MFTHAVYKINIISNFYQLQMKFEYSQAPNKWIPYAKEAFTGLKWKVYMFLHLTTS